MKIDPSKRYLMIVESPNKVKTISQMFKEEGIKNIIVQASVGHITRIADSGDYNMGIDVKNNFKADYQIAEDKKEIVHKLREQVKAADFVILATDPDREGEAISYHLMEELKIPKKKYTRVTYHEITKTAIMKGIENDRGLDLDLVAAAVQREKLDKIIGYRLSGIARKNVGAKSVGRCQSPGLKILVDREEEIQNFKSKKYFELQLDFEKDKKQYQAHYIGTDKNKIDHFDKIEDAQQIIDQCKGNDYFVKDIINKERKLNAKPPFTTSTYQQECASKLGLSIEKAMWCAQKLFEGIDIDGRHQALITYLRTDSTEMSPEFVDELKDFILINCGKEFYAPVKIAKKKGNEQDGHEAIRPVDLQMTPSKVASLITDQDLIDVYRLIYNRTLASSMSAAIINDTIYTFNNKDNLFQMTLSQLVFSGFKAVYDYKEDTEDIEDKCSLKEKEKLQNTNLQLLEKETKPPKRYSQAGLVKKLEDLGIGRPSTYATIIAVLLDKKRNYCTLENKVFVPTELGINLSHFLEKSFSSVISIGYTAEMENELDAVAKGEKDSIECLTEFYKALEEDIKKVSPESTSGEKLECPNCGKSMALKSGRYGPFWACTGYPKCKTIISVKDIEKKSS